MATVEKDGGPAFPKMPDEIRNGSSGMSLREWLAGQALAGLMANSGGPVQASPMRGWQYTNCGHADIAREAFKIADAMLAERNK